ncbi:MAG: hypothetical protein P8178_02940 [Candidatus Thiodiazotropha sp.]
METNSIDGGRAQLQAIHAMLASGHASVRMERHTFVLWGLAAGGLILLVPQLFSVERFTDPGQRLWLQNGFISLVLLGVGVLDAVWTARIRSRRDETLSFVQRQVTKLWWLLIALVVVINIGMNLYGGGYFFYGITLVLTGIGIYVHGLFSRQMLTWSGALQILLGLVMIAVSPEIHVQEWVAASAFGIGFPAFALMADRKFERSVSKELLLTLGWLALVLVPAFVAVSLWQGHRFESWPHLTWEGYLQRADASDGESLVVTLPAGTTVPVSVHVSGDLLQPVEQPAPVMMQTTRPVGLAIDHGQVLGLMRISDGEWRSGFDYRIERWKAEGKLNPIEGPAVDLNMHVAFER